MTTPLAQLQAMELASAANIPVRTRLVLGNYCRLGTATASSNSTGFPPSGAIDGNRTELYNTLNGNLPPWRSNVAPTGGSPQYVQIDLGAATKANFMKIYFEVAKRPLTWMVSVSSNGSTWTDIGATSDIAAVYTTTVPSYTIPDAHNEVIQFRFADDSSYLTFRYIKLTVFRMVTPADLANCVELECYRKLDISDRVDGFTVQRDLDYKLQNLLASTATITASNSDKFFSFEYVPRTVETNFINSELNPGIGVEILAGNNAAILTETVTAGSSNPTIYDPATGNLPQAATPAWTRSNSGVTVNTETASGGKLTIDTTNSSGIHELSYLRTFTAPTTGDYLQITFTASTFGTNASNNGFRLEIANGVQNRFGFLLHSNGIYLAGTTTQLYAMDCQGSHVFKIVITSSTTVDVYVDGVVRITGQGPSFTLGAAAGYVFFAGRGTQNSQITEVRYSDPIVVPPVTVAHPYDDGIVRLFTGNMDRLTVNPGARSATLEFRDAFRDLIRKIFSAGLLTATDIGNIQKYIFNVANVSNYEMVVDPTAIILDYFYTTEEDLLTTLRALVTAVGDGTMYFDEYNNGVARMFMGVTLQKIISSTAEFVAGIATFQNVTNWSDEIQRKWFLIDDFADGNFTSNPVWTPLVTDNASTWNIASGTLHLLLPNPGGSAPIDANGAIATPFSQVVGTWKATVTFAPAGNSGGGGEVADFYFMAGGYSDPGGIGSKFTNGYFVRLDRPSGNVGLYAQSSAFASPSALALSATTGHDFGSSSHTIAIERDADGTVRVYYDGTLEVTHLDNTYTSSSYLGFHLYGNYLPSELNVDDIYFSHATNAATSSTSTAQAIYESDKIDQGLYITTEGILNATTVTPSGTSLSFFTATSADGTTWASYVAATLGSAIASTPQRYIKVKVVFNVPQDSAGNNANVNTGIVYDITVNWNASAGSSKYPGSASRTFRWDGMVMEIQQELTDVVGGNVTLANDVTAKSNPQVLQGNNTDIVWSATTQVPLVAISASAPLAVNAGDTLVFRPILSSAMDVSLMSGVNPAAAAITYASGAAGTSQFTTIHPTRPVLSIAISATGTITLLNLIGKTFATSPYGIAQESKDSTSISNYGIAQRGVDSPWIQQNSIAKSIADRVISLFKDPLYQLSNCVLKFTPSVSPRQRVTIVDENTAISRDFLIAGVTHSYRVNESGADSSTVLRLFRI